MCDVEDFFFETFVVLVLRFLVALFDVFLPFGDLTLLSLTDPAGVVPFNDLLTVVRLETEEVKTGFVGGV